MGVYCVVIYSVKVRDPITELSIRTRLRNYVTESYYGISLRNYIAELVEGPHGPRGLLPINACHKTKKCPTKKPRNPTRHGILNICFFFGCCLHFLVNLPESPGISWRPGARTVPVVYLRRRTSKQQKSQSPGISRNLLEFLPPKMQ